MTDGSFDKVTQVLPDGRTMFRFKDGTYVGCREVDLKAMLIAAGWNIERRKPYCQLCNTIKPPPIKVTIRYGTFGSLPHGPNCHLEYEE